MLGDDHARRGRDVVDRRDTKVNLVAVPTLASVVLSKNVVRDREHVGPETRVPAEPIARLDTREKRALNEVVDVVPQLAAEEPTQRVEVTLDELLRGGVVSGSPCAQQLGVGGRHRSGIPAG